jgi:methionyl-tRNA formyltransferase
LLRASRSDIAVSINYTGVLPQGVIDLFPIGVLNAHGGDLPRYRGKACQAWAIINRESRIGLCIQKMIGGELDSGEVFGVCETVSRFTKREYCQLTHQKVINFGSGSIQILISYSALKVKEKTFWRYALSSKRFIHRRLR